MTAPTAGRPGRSRARVMFKHLLVPIDLSDRNARALRMAREVARRTGARVTLLHVVQQIPNLLPDELQTFYRRLVETSSERLERAARPFAAARVRVATAVAIGDPAGQIIRAAAKGRVDLIVMDSHRVNPARPARAGWGTTSYKVGILCPCPVLLVK